MVNQHFYQYIHGYGDVCFYKRNGSDEKTFDSVIIQSECDHNKLARLDASQLCIKYFEKEFPSKKGF